MNRKHKFNWSYSTLDVYLNCPRQFYLKKILKKYTKVKSDNLAIGTGAHGFLQFYAMHPKATRRECETAYRNAVEVSKLEHKLAVRQFQPLVKTYMESGKRLTPKDSTCVEKKYLIECHGVPFIAYVDIIDDKDRVCDYKTSSFPYKTLRVQESLQLTLYALCYYEEYGVLPWRVGYQILLKDFSGVQELWDARTLSQIESARQLVKTCDDEVQNCTNFEARRGKKCSYCDYKSSCLGK